MAREEGIASCWKGAFSNCCRSAALTAG